MVSKYEFAQELADSIPRITRPLFTGRVMALGEDAELPQSSTLLTVTDIVPELRIVPAIIADTRIFTFLMRRQEKRLLRNNTNWDFTGAVEITRRWGRLRKNNFSGEHVSVFVPSKK